MKKILLISVFIASFTGCENRKSPKPDVNGRNVLAYIVADNNLASFAFNDINEMELSWDDNNNGQMFVFFNKRGGESTLYRIKQDSDMSTINSEILAIYPPSVDPCDVAFFKGVIGDVYGFYPAKNRGLILWSHGSGWLPKGVRYPYRAAQDRVSRLDFVASESDYSGQNRTIGSSDSFASEMEIYDIAVALKGLKFDFISFDACYMAGIEVYYELRNIATYLFASAAETLATGAPYDKITNMMFEKEINMSKIAKSCFDYYASETGMLQSSTYSVIRADKLENLAAVTKKIVTPITPTTNDIQQFGRSPFNDIYFDFENFMRKYYGTHPLYSDLLKALNDAVIFKAATPVLFNLIRVNSHCGLTAYIPKMSQPNTLKVYRERYSWSTDSGIGKIF